MLFRVPRFWPYRTNADWHSNHAKRSLIPGPKACFATPEFLKHEGDIGTGPMEAQCKATTRRIKGSGMRWDLENAEALVGLEALYQSHQWDQWWSNTRCHMN